MKTHSKEVLDTISCPFPIDIKSINWNEVEKIMSTDDKKRSVILKMKDDNIFLVEIPKILYDAIHLSGEENAIEQDLGFNDLN